MTGTQDVRRGLIWARLTDEDVLVGRLGLGFPSQLGRYPNYVGLHADLNVAADKSGCIMLRVPESVAPMPEEFVHFEDVDEIWEPVLDTEEGLVGGRGLLHYHTFRLPGHQIFLEIFAEEKPFGCRA